MIIIIILIHLDFFTRQQESFEEMLLMEMNTEKNSRKLEHAHYKYPGKQFFEQMRTVHSKGMKKNFKT